jgi:asparagine synthetase B (glutamine-hydrolysing)
MPRWALHVGPVGHRTEAEGTTLHDFGVVGLTVSGRGQPPIRSLAVIGRRADEVSPEIELTQGNGAIRLTVPLSSPERVFCRQDRDGVALANDPRVLLTPSDELSAKGLLGLLTFGVLIPPLSLWKEVVQLPPGFDYTLSIPGLCLTRSARPPVWDGVAPAGGSLDDEVCGALDAALEALVPGSGVKLLFSGGVDSSLLAVQLARLARCETELIHCQTSPRSLDTRCARAIADEIGLPLRIVPYDEEMGLQACAEHLPDNYLPFTDFVGPAMMQLLATLSQPSSPVSCIVDGAGADGAFGSSAALRRMATLSRVPRQLFAPAWRLYTRCQLWKHPRGRGEHTIRRLAKLGALNGCLKTLVYQPFPLAETAAASSLLDIEADVQEWMTEAGRGLPAHLHYALLPLIGSNQGSSFSFADRHGYAAAFPFMHPTVLGVAFGGLRRDKRWDSGDKGPLKRLLERHVSARWVRRPKRGFTYPPSRTFGHPRFLALFDELLDDEAHPIFDVVRRAELAEMRQWSEAQRPMSWFAYGFVWACLSSYRWIEHTPKF